MTFKLLMRETEELSLAQLGFDVVIHESAARRIMESENLERDDDLRYVADFDLPLHLAHRHLKRWCSQYVHGKWAFTNKTTAILESQLVFRFSLKSEAMRFKLTWGGC